MRERRGARQSVATELIPAWLALWLLPADASAYIDPGTGSFVLQTLVAALLTAGFLLRTFWRRLIGVFRRRKPTEKADRTGPGE